MERREYLESLTVAGVDVERLVPASNGTIFADDANTASDVTLDADPAGSELPVLVGANGDITLGGAIGDGGMGIVRLAQQRALRRDVAVKSARLRVATPEARSEGASALVREARITGALEHPNIVPVHTLGKAPDGSVLLVMKRIEGKAWSQLLASRSPPLEDLRRHVEVLLDVCRAVQFAHSRGMLHRDLKPANVMVGPFGEVYVLDWGIAVPTGEIPRSIAGTPSFMAPEMAMPGKDVLDERTDVYLLGAVLHVVLTGRAPHMGATVADMLHAAFTAAPPELPPEAPDELAAICRRALARDKAARFASAAAFRDALAAWVEHTSAHALSNEAQRQLAKLRALVDQTARGDDAEREGAVYRAYSASRFGFEQALREWPAFVDARAGLDDTLRALTRYELKLRRADRARALLADLGDDRALAQQLSALEQTLAVEMRERSRLEAIARSFEFSAQSRRLLTAVAFILVPWLVFAFVCGHMNRIGAIHITALHLVFANVPNVLAFAALSSWFKRRGDALMARISALFLTQCCGVVLSWIGIAFLDAPLVLGFAAAHLLLAFGAIAAAIFARPALGLAAVPLLASIPIFFAWPDLLFEANGAALAAAIGLLTALWPRSPPKLTHE